MEYADGKFAWFTSGPGWQWKEDAIRSANIYRGERIDFRLDYEFRMNRGLDFIAFANSIGWMITDLAGICYDSRFGSRVLLALAPNFPAQTRPSRQTNQFILVDSAFWQQKS